MTTRSPRVRIGLLCAFVLAATVMSGGFARHASGAIVQVTPSPLAPGLLLINYIAEPGERNRVQATESGGTVVFAESGAPVVLVGEPSGCVQRSTNEVACALPSAFNIGVQLGDADDTALIATTLQQGTGVGGVLGGPGRDVLVGGGGAERLSGGPDDDQLFGGEGYDVLVGDEGSDVLRGGDGNDRLIGGVDTARPGPLPDAAGDDLGGDAGEDTVYEVGGQDAPVTVSLDDQPNDGAAGEGDLVRTDIENVNVNAAPGGNTIIGNAGPNDLRISGTGPGNTIVGGGGPDSLTGKGRMLGGAGNDALEGQGMLLGGAGNDALEGYGVLLGGAGNDHITAVGRGRFDGGPGADHLDKDWHSDERPDNPARLLGGTGNDTIDAIDMWCDSSISACKQFPVPVKDTVTCGPGRDIARLGERDTARPDCERTTSK